MLFPAISEATAMERNFSSALEPRLVGRQIGLHPLATLLAFYVGYRLMGVLGMILFPIASILIKQLFELFSAPQANTKKG